MHHWVLDATCALPMTVEERRRWPYRIKRLGRCKLCQVERVHWERVMANWRSR